MPEPLPFFLRTDFLPKIPELCLRAVSQNPYSCHLLHLRVSVTAGRNLVYFAYKCGARPLHRLIIHPMLPTQSVLKEDARGLCQGNHLSLSHCQVLPWVTPHQSDSLAADKFKCTWQQGREGHLSWFSLPKRGTVPSPRQHSQPAVIPLGL